MFFCFVFLARRPLAWRGLLRHGIPGAPRPLPQFLPRSARQPGPSPLWLRRRRPAFLPHRLRAVVAPLRGKVTPTGPGRRGRRGPGEALGARRGGPRPFLPAGTETEGGWAAGRVPAGGGATSPGAGGKGGPGGAGRPALTPAAFPRREDRGAHKPSA